MIKKIKMILSVAMTTVIMFTNTQINVYAEQAYSSKDNLIPENVILNYREMENVSKSFEYEKPELMPVRGSLPASYSASYSIPESIEVEQKEDHILLLKIKIRMVHAGHMLL